MARLYSDHAQYLLQARMTLFLLYALCSMPRAPSPLSLRGAKRRGNLPPRSTNVILREKQSPVLKNNLKIL